MKFLYIIRFFHFSKTDDAPDYNSPNYERLWKLRHISDLLNDGYSKYYTPPKNLTVDKVIILFNGGKFSDNTYPRNTNV
jgi:hypothetical protein